MPDTEQTQATDEHAAAMDQGCPVNMFNLRRCGRPLHIPLPGFHDPIPVCIMHSLDPHKSSAEFQQEFERTLADPEGGIANFSGFVFPSSNYGRRLFPAKCIFNRAVFLGMADFTGATFDEEAIFSQAVFKQQANFPGCTFKGHAMFAWAVFTQGASFVQAKFMQEGRFHSATFARAVDFSAARFSGDAYFTYAKFMHNVYFNLVRFTSPANPEGNTNKKDPTKNFPFIPTTFERKADFRHVTFSERAEFRQTRFREDGALEASPVFGLARFDKPKLVVFHGTYLGRALFHNCDVSEFLFAKVRWRRRDNGKRAVFDEDERLKLDQEATITLLPEAGSHDSRNYGLVAELYQQLKKNYDDRRDYWTAGDFHYGEMEMKRLSSRQRKPMRRWLHQNLGLAAWYQYASDYGESYVKPFLRLLVVLALFTLIYPACGLHRRITESPRTAYVQAQAGSTAAPTIEISYRDFRQYLEGYPHRPWRGTASFFVQSFTTSVGVAALHRDFSDYEPQSVLGRFAALIELLLTSTLVVLFLLAVRRQFRR